MRKFFMLILVFPFLFCFSACQKSNPYLFCVSELRENLYSAETEGYNITACYGFREYPFIADGKAGDRVYGYTFKISGVQDEIRRTVEITDGDKNLSADFCRDEITGEYKANIETERYFADELKITLVCGAEKTPLTLTSVIPENCLPYEKILDLLAEKQKPLLAAYTVDGNFNAEIYMRVFVKNGKPFWYIGIFSGKNNLKAFLTDGFTGELIAVREIM